MGANGGRPFTDLELDRWVAKENLIQQARGRIVVGVDPAGVDDHTLRWAGDQAARSRAGLTLLVVHGPTSHLPETQPTPELLTLASAQACDLLAQARQRVLSDRPALDVQVVAINDDRDKILHAVTESAALTVLGAGSLHSTRGRLFGGTAGIVSATADGPVVVVPNRYTQNVNGPLTLGVDLSGSCDTAVEYAAIRARELGAELHLVFAWELARYSEAGRLEQAVWLSGRPSQSIREGLAAMGDSLRQRFPQLVVRVTIIEGKVGQVLQECASRSRQLIIGSRGLSGLHAWLAGSTSRAVLCRAKTPVIVVPRAARNIVPTG